MNISTILEQAGFSEKQGQVYLTLLKHADLSPTALSEKTGIDRTLCYAILNQLMEKGYVVAVIGEGAKKFRAVNPERILNTINEIRSNVQSALPELKKMAHGKREETTVEMLKGRKAVEGQFLDVLASGVKEYHIFGEIKNHDIHFPIQTTKFLRELERRKIIENIIYRRGPNPMISKTSKVRYVPEHLISPSTTWIYGNKVAVVIWSDPFVMVRITNKEMADTYRSYFGLLWKQAKTK